MKGLPYSPLAWKLFQVAFAPRMRMGVHGIRMAGLPRQLDPDQPLLLVSNHVSWWDGFILRSLQQALRPEDPFHTVMLERELGRRPFLRLLGGVGLTPGSPGSLKGLLRELTEARERAPGLTVLFFPQGRIWPSHRRPLGFQEGIRVVARALSPVTVLPVGLHLEPGRWPAPTAYLSISEPISVRRREISPRLLETKVQEELDAIRSFLAFQGEAADESWPGPYESLPSYPETLATAETP
jgi:1-acyl-sn-glycerol-3-phosphate acyltransferase